MAEHVRAIFVVSMLRSMLEFLLGAYVLLVAWRWGAEWTGFWSYLPTYHPESKPLPDDRVAFVVLGAVVVVLGSLRLIQALSAFLLREWGRRLGRALAIVDFLTPLTLPLGLWVLLVYRHPETRDFFRRNAETGARLF